jgi:hypothetical protein
MQSIGNGSPEARMGIAKEEVRAERFPLPHRRDAVTTRRIRNGLEALAALPYYLLGCPITQPRRMARFLENIFEYQRAERVHACNQRLIPTVDVEQLFPGLFHQTASILDLGSRPSGTTFFETYLLVLLIKFLGARRIFEFGTYEGRTTLQFALNAPEDATIYTLDLPDKHAVTRFDRSDPNEASTRKLPVGGLFQHYAKSGRIKQFLQDSATVDFEPFRGKMDFVFVDGDHSMSYVKSDSENAFSMLSPGGVILWHDYAGRWPDVPRYLRDTAVRKKLYHLAGTSLVLYRLGTQHVSSSSC